MNFLAIADPFPYGIESVFIHGRREIDLPRISLALNKCREVLFVNTDKQTTSLDEATINTTLSFSRLVFVGSRESS